MLSFSFLRNEYKKVKAFKKLFYDENGELKAEAKIVLATLRDVADAKGNLTDNGSPLLYDANSRFDSAAAAMILGKRRMFDLIIKYLSINEITVFNLLSEDDKNDETLLKDLII